MHFYKMFKGLCYKFSNKVYKSRADLKCVYYKQIEAQRLNYNHLNREKFQEKEKNLNEQLQKAQMALEEKEKLLQTKEVDLNM